MTEKEFKKKLKELKNSKPRSEHRLELFYKGNNVGCIYGDGNLYEIEINDWGTHLLVYTDTFGLLIDDAELRGI